MLITTAKTKRKKRKMPVKAEVENYLTYTFGNGKRQYPKRSGWYFVFTAKCEVAKVAYFNKNKKCWSKSTASEIELYRVYAWIDWAEKRLESNFRRGTLVQADYPYRVTGSNGILYDVR